MHTLNGFFINLDRSPERAKQMRAELDARKLGFVERFAAVDARTLSQPPACKIPMAAYGAFLSHQMLITQTPPDSVTLIFEDDMQVSDSLAGMLSPENLKILAELDLVFFDCQLYINFNDLLLRYWEVKRGMPNPRSAGNPESQQRHAPQVGLGEASGAYCWGASAYLVTPRGKEKLGPILQQTLDRGPPGTLDILFRNLIESKALDARVVVPFLATPRLDGLTATTIDGRQQDFLPFALCSMVRRLYFAGDLDIDGMIEFFAPASSGPLPKTEDEMMVELIRQLARGLVHQRDFLDFGI
ncbi:glycosyltransferase family 25 protein [Polaromonas sp. YR568]|uniref:glycosyltransferase family 25 protein n=1 Tax=Polaromonas sp. YR568 TaxID=1855301 RepID=UPI000B847BC8|nr:glycosyltransferase family 25 protein [Polaromonas sp. YR568]